jgi:endoribonuclease LACTB2
VTTPRSPRLAAGVIVRRRRDGAVLLGARTEHARSWPGTLAFPGGAVDDDDHLLPLRSRLSGEQAAYRGGALREALEEAGLVMLCHGDGTACDDDVARDIVARMARGERLIAILAGSGLWLDDTALRDLGAWLTAEGSFLVARFLLAVDEAPRRLPPPTQELRDLALQDPVALVEGWQDGRVFLPPPIRTQLRRLADLARQHPGDDDVAATLRVPPGEGERRRKAVVAGVALLDPKTPTLWPATTTNCVVLGCGDVLLVDPAAVWTDERAAFDNALDVTLEGRAVRGVFLTHHHHDHVGDAARQKARFGCPVYAHRLTAEQLDDGLVDIVIDDGFVFDLPGAGHGPDRRFVAVHTPGHARGHLCLWEERLRLLVAGDMVAAVGSILIDPPEGHMATYLASLRRLIALSPRSLVPAHGPLLVDAVARLEQQVQHRLARGRKVYDAVVHGAHDVEGIVAVAYGPDTPPQMFPFAARSVHAIMEQLVEDGRCVVDGDGWRAA